jgi:hypothetical protein
MALGFFDIASLHKSFVLNLSCICSNEIQSSFTASKLTLLVLYLRAILPIILGKVLTNFSTKDLFSKSLSGMGSSLSIEDSEKFQIIL